MRVGIIGINHKLANLELREKLAQACHRCFVGGGSSHEEHTFVLLTTCNRSEVYFYSTDLASAHSYLLQILRQEIENEFDQKVYSYFGYDCFLHLARVTAGLDSAIVAETEIQGQVKSAYENAAHCFTLPSELHYLFQKALMIGKKVRTELAMGRGMADLEHAIFNTGVQLFKTPEQPKILFVGASEVNCKILSFLKSKDLQDITICNRSPMRAKEVADGYGLSLLDWSNISQWHKFNWIIFGTKAPHYLVTKDNLPKENLSHKLIIDLCVPRNVEPTLGKNPNITLLNIDQINRRLKLRKEQLSHSLTQAEEIITTSALQHMHLFRKRESRQNSGT